MCQFQQFRFPSSDGSSSCYAGAWLPPEEPRGVVQIVHGVGEHIGRYETAARFLTRQGFLVCGEDHLGHGNTVQDGRYGAFAPQNGWKLVVADIARLRRIQGEKHPGVPYFLLGHSMGSFLTRTYLIDHPGRWTEPSCRGPAGARPPGGFRKAAGRTGVPPAGV